MSRAARRMTAWQQSGIALAGRGLDETQRLAHRLASLDLKPQLARLRDAPRALALPFSHDEREVLALLFLPVLLIASAIVTQQSVRALQNYVTSIAVPDQEIASLRPQIEGVARAAVATRTPAREVSAALDIAETRPEASTARSIAAVPHTLTTADAEKTIPPVTVEGPPAPPAPPTKTLPAADLPAPTHAAQGETQLALFALPPDLAAPQPFPPDAILGYEAGDDGKPVLPGICTVAEAERAAATSISFEPVPAGGEAFGRRLAEVAQSQVGSFVIYTDAYRSLRYPMGDVNRFFGVCTDVVVRAYRELGIDLQALVHQARSGRGDPNIDHRRTEVLRRFFATQGQTLPVTAFPEDYRPGDIVTYYRPQNRGSRSHIAIVSSVIAPSGRPMIIHNRGWGPQLEDALFVDEMTGHYRYSGPAQTRNAENTATARNAPVIPASFSPKTLRAE